MSLAVLMVIVSSIMIVTMVAAWLVQWYVSNAGYIDVFWTIGAGVSGVLVALWPIDRLAFPNFRQIVIAVLVAAWSLRLSVYLVRRVAMREEDSRYRALRDLWAGRFQSRVFWFALSQSICGIILLLAVLAAAHNPAPVPRSMDFVALGVLAIAVVGEAMADHQLAMFKRNPSNRGKICDQGLWAWSRHPNYFFEWLGWLAYPLFAIDLDGAYPWGWLSLVGPALMYGLLAHVSGVPPLEQQMSRRYGAAYQAYRARTRAFVPLPRYRGHALPKEL